MAEKSQKPISLPKHKDNTKVKMPLDFQNIYGIECAGLGAILRPFKRRDDDLPYRR